MKRTAGRVLGLALLLVVVFAASPGLTFGDDPARAAGTPVSSDRREPVRLTSTERDTILAEMRTMLTSVSRILHGLASGDMTMVAQAARSSGAAAALPADLAGKLPAQFLQLGIKTHQRFDQLADATTTGRGDVVKRLAAISGYCVACHSNYRLEFAP